MSSNQPQRTLLGQALTQDPSVFSFYQATKPLVDKLEAVRAEALPRLLNDHAQKVNQIEADSNLSAPGKMQARTELAGTVLPKIDALQQDAQKTVESLEARIKTALAGPPLSTQDALLREQQMMRAWQRIKGVLDGITSPVLMVNRIQGFANEALAQIGDAGRPTIQALREELPAYLEARGINVWPQADSLITQAEAPSLTPVQRAAQQMAYVCESGWPRLLIAFNQARAAVQRGVGASNTALPGFIIPDRMQF